MIAVITGDIINSRQVNSKHWQPKLKKLFTQNIADSKKWEIYRGDSFQIEVKVEEAIEWAVTIKALLRSIEFLNVRMSIGIGDKSYSGKKITESNGSAFIHSGESFDKLKQETLSMKSPFVELDDYFNPILKLIGFITDNWKPVTAETIFYALENRLLRQKELAEKLNKNSATISKALKRGGYDEISEALNLYTKKINICMNS